MAKRIKPYAERVGGKTISDWIPSDERTLQKNRAWIEQMKSEGREMVDIGPKFPRRLGNEEAGKLVSSEAYGVERKALAIIQGIARYSLGRSDSLVAFRDLMSLSRYCHSWRT